MGLDTGKGGVLIELKGSPLNGSRTTRPIKSHPTDNSPHDYSPHRRLVPWTTRPVDKLPHRQLAAGTTRLMDNSSHGQLAPRLIVLDFGRPSINGSIRSIKCIAGLNVQCKRDWCVERCNLRSRELAPSPEVLRVST
jgi:hypothetical protein